jgi:hypothetical protein
VPPAPVGERRQIAGHCTELERGHSALELAGMIEKTSTDARLGKRPPVDCPIKGSWSGAAFHEALGRRVTEGRGLAQQL